MKFRLLIAAFFVVLASFAALPAAAGACASLAGVHSFTGHAYLSFDGSASGPIEGSGGGEAISLERTVTNLELKLTHKVVGRGKFKGVVIFSGKARGGNVAIHDTFQFTDGGGSGTETHNGPTLPTLASVVLDTKKCLYAVSTGFAAKTTFNGEPDLRPGNNVSVGVIGDREKIPADLHLIGGVGPDAYLSCPGDPLLTGQPCISFAGGWATDFAELKQCGSFPPEGNCASADKAVGSGKFIWVLKPS